MIQKGRIVGCGAVAQFLEKGPTPVELGFTGISVADAHTVGQSFGGFASLRETPDGIRALAPASADLNALLSRLIARGARILQVAPVRPTLESFFIQQEIKPEVASTDSTLREPASAERGNA